MMITRTDVYGDHDADFEKKINKLEREGWAVRQIVVLPATINTPDWGSGQVIRSNIIVVFETDKK